MTHTTKYIFDIRGAARYRFPTHINELVMDRADAEASEAFVVVVEPGRSTPRHMHQDTEQIFYVLEGEGILQVGDGPERYPLVPGNLVRIPRHTYHLVECIGQEPLRYLAIDCFVKGKPQDEPTWDSHVRNVCLQNGWDFDEIRQTT